MTTEQAAEYLGYGSVEHLEKNDISDRSEWWELIKKLTSKDETELNLHLVSYRFDVPNDVVGCTYYSDDAYYDHCGYYMLDQDENKVRPDKKYLVVK